jgi:hypothetical protein
LSVEYRSRYDTRASLCWEEKSEKLFRVWIGNECRGFPYDKLVEACYFAEEQTLSLHWPTGQIIIVGPKALALYNEVANQKATLLKADGVDILSVTLHAQKTETDPVSQKGRTT